MKPDPRYTPAVIQHLQEYAALIEGKRFDEAARFLNDNLIPVPLYFRYGAYDHCVTLLRCLVSDEGLPLVPLDPDLVGRAQHDLGLAWALLGELRKAHSLFALSIAEAPIRFPLRRAVSLLNLADMVYIPRGELKKAEHSLREGIMIAQSLGDSFVTALIHYSLGRLAIYAGVDHRAEENLTTALFEFEQQQQLRSQGLIWATRAFHALTIHSSSSALAAAQYSQHLVAESNYERDSIRAAWLVGSSAVAVLTEHRDGSVSSHALPSHLSTMSEVRRDLMNTLNRCRSIHLRELESDILLSLARSHLAGRDVESARNLGNEAATLAAQSGYRLTGAEIELFLAETAQSVNDNTAVELHATKAIELGRCDGPPHCYRRALRIAEHLIANSSSLSAETTTLPWMALPPASQKAPRPEELSYRAGGLGHYWISEQSEVARVTALRDIREWVEPYRSHAEEDILENWQFEATLTLYDLYQDLSHFDLGRPPSRWWPHWNIPSDEPASFSPGAHHEDTDTPIAGVAAVVWLYEHASTLFSEVALVLDRAGLRKTLEPTRLAEKLIEILRDQSKGMPPPLRLELLARFMVSVGIDIVPADADWKALLRQFVEHEVSTCYYPYLRPLLRWAVEIELGPEDATLEDRRRSFEALRHQTRYDWNANLLNCTADLLLMLEMWRPATPIVEHAAALDPFDDATMDTHGWALFFERDYVAAERELKKSLDAKSAHPRSSAELYPERRYDSWCIVQYHRFQVALWAHRLPDARAIVDEMQATAPQNRLTIEATKLKALLAETAHVHQNANNSTSEYDVALSFAGEDRRYADQIARSLVERGITVFYDDFERAALWGEDLYQYLSNVYQHRARFCIVFISVHYAQKRWTTLECRAAQARAFQENSPYLLPVRIDDTEIPGIFPTLGYMSWHKDGAELIVQALVQKLQRRAVS